jgi:PAS domain S-box-containing protein
MNTANAPTEMDFLAAVIEATQDAMISTTPDGVITRWSPAAERMLGYSATEVISRPIFTIIPPSLVDKERALMSRLAEDGRTVRHGTVRVCKGGRPLDVAATLSPVRDATGTTIEILSIARELTDQKREELVRRESEERFRLIADATPVMIKSTGINGEFDFVNKAYLNFTGRRMDETLGIGWAEAVHPEDLQHCLELHLTAFCERRFFQIEFRLRRHDGEYRWILDLGVPRFDADGRFLGYVGSHVDITDRRRAEELEARIEERTRIARELHDTLLQNFHAVLPRLQLAYELLPSSPKEAREQLQNAIDTAARAITQGRRAVQGLRSSMPQTADLADAIRAIGEELAGLECNATPALRVVVEGEPRNLHPILQDEVYWITAESLRNAFRHAQAQNIYVEICYGDTRFHVHIRDDGKGFDPEILSAGVRERHFGLDGMRERTKVADGNLTIVSEVGSGTEIELTIPASSAYKISRFFNASVGALSEARSAGGSLVGYDGSPADVATP